MEELYKAYLASTGVSIDSRSIDSGQMFFAIRGERFNGHDYVADVLAKGASIVVVSEDVPIKEKGKLIYVEDTLVALQGLARMHRRKLEIPVLAITGSNGKTTTKELTAVVLNQKFRVGYTLGNFNNHIGLPLTILNLKKGVTFAVLEMGANKPGDIEELCIIAEPNYGLITNIGRAHLEGFGSLQGVLETKGELFDYIKANEGTFFLNAEELGLAGKVGEYDKTIKFSSIKTGRGKEIRLLSNDKGYCDVAVEDFEESISTQLYGSYNVKNIASAITIAEFFGIPSVDMIQSLSNFNLSMNRSELKEVKGIRVVLDAYNANPTSMKATIDSFETLDSKTKWLILGDMLELGADSEIEHRGLLDKVSGLPWIDRVYCVGPLFYQLREAYPFKFYKSRKDLSMNSELKDQSSADLSILIKGSRGIALEKLLEEQ